MGIGRRIRSPERDTVSTREGERVDRFDDRHGKALAQDRFLRRFEAPHSLREQRGASSRGPVHLVLHLLRVSVTSPIGQLTWTPRWYLGHRARPQPLARLATKQANKAERSVKGSSHMSCFYPVAPVNATSSASRLECRP